MDQFLPYITFFDSENQSIFWQYVGAILFTVMPLILIYVASIAAKHLIHIVRRAFSSRNRRYDYEPRRGYDIKYD